MSAPTSDASLLPTLRRPPEMPGPQHSCTLLRRHDDIVSVPLVASSPTNQEAQRTLWIWGVGVGGWRGWWRGGGGGRGVADCGADLPEGVIVFRPRSAQTHSLLRLLLASTRAHARSLLLLRSDGFV